MRLSEIAAFGDYYNDIIMLREYGIGVAMNNAISERIAVCIAVADCFYGDSAMMMALRNGLRKTCYEY